MPIERVVSTIYPAIKQRKFILPNLGVPLLNPRAFINEQVLPFGKRILGHKFFASTVLGIAPVKPRELTHTNGHGKFNGNGHVDLGKLIPDDKHSNGQQPNGRLNDRENGHKPDKPKTLREKVAETEGRVKKLHEKIDPILKEKQLALKQAEDKREAYKTQAKAAKEQFIVGLAQILVDQNDRKSKPTRNFTNSSKRHNAHLSRARSEARKIFKNLRNGDLALSTLELSFDLPDELAEQLNQFDQAKEAQKAAAKPVARARRELKPWDIWNTYLGAQVTVDGYWNKMKLTQESIRRKIEQVEQSRLYQTRLDLCLKIIAGLKAELALTDRELRSIIPKEVLAGRVADKAQHRELLSELLQHTQEIRQMLIGEDISPDELAAERAKLKKQVQELRANNIFNALTAVTITATAVAGTANGTDVLSMAKVISDEVSNSFSSPLVVRIESPFPLFPNLKFFQIDSKSKTATKPGFLYDQEIGIYFPADGRKLVILLNELHQLSDPELEEFKQIFGSGATVSPITEPTAEDTAETADIIEPPLATTVPATATVEATQTPTSIPTETPFTTSTPKPSPTTANGTATVEAQTGERRATAIVSATAKAGIDNATATAAMEIRNATAEAVNATATTGARRDATTSTAVTRGEATVTAKAQAAPTAVATVRAKATPIPKPTVSAAHPIEAPKTMQVQSEREPYLMQLLRGFANSLNERCKPFDAILDRVSTGRWREIFKILMRRESSCIPTAISRTNDWGLLQINRISWEADFKEVYGDWDTNIFIPELNIMEAESIRKRYGIRMWATYYGE